MRRQALYRVEWDDGPPTITKGVPPATVTITDRGPWGGATFGSIIYEGPLGPTTITVAYNADAAKATGP